jgi:NOL1/NOP2/sun family putative RNA methylase
MSGRNFFLKRYEEFGWKFKKPQLKQSIRVNTANANEAQVVDRLENRGVQLQRIPFLQHGYWITETRFSLGATVEYLLGLYSIQEAAAQIPVSLFKELRGRTVLDACAAPGGKTIQLSDLMNNTGAIVALDVDGKRLTALANQLERCNSINSIVYQMDARKASDLRLRFDRILLDVPCSGNFAADPRWFKRRTISDVEANARIQKQILAAAVEVLSDGGEIVYSTCSLEPEEDELNIQWAIEELGVLVEKVNCYGEEASTNIFGRHLDDSISRCRRIWPGQTQGFFTCKLGRRDE